MRSYAPPNVIASWPPPNDVNPETRGPILYIVNSVFFVLATIAVGVRMYTRIFIRNWFGIDDVFIILAFILMIGVTGMIFYSYAHYSWDRHVWDAGMKDIPHSAKAIFTIKIIWSSASSFVRISLLLFYYRLLNHIEIQRYRWVLHCVLFFVVSIMFSYIGTTIFACIPIRAYWSWPLVPGICIDERLALLTLSSLNTFSEFVVAVLPIPIVLSLRMEKRQRWSVISLLCLGIFVTIVGCIRTYYVWLSYETYDATWWSGPHWICSEVEIDTALICACAPAIRPFVDRMLSRNGKHPSPSYANSKPKDVSTGSGDFDLITDWSIIDKPGYYENLTNTQTYRKYDLEGIGGGNFGYTVKISTGPDTNDGATIGRGNIWGTKSSHGENVPELDGHNPENFGGLLKRRWLQWKGNGSKNVSHSPSASNLAAEIVTRKSLDVRYSIYEVEENNIH